MKYLLLVLLTLLPVALRADTTIDTTGSWDGIACFRYMGESATGPGNATATYGQTFTTPAVDTRLDSFSFWLQWNSGGNSQMDYAAYVMAWDGTKAVGPMLYQSAPQYLPNTATSMTRVDLDTPGVNLTSGHVYVAFLSVSNFLDGKSEYVNMEKSLNSPPYSGGNFVYCNNLGDFSLLTSQQWDGYARGWGDAAFVAQFDSPSGGGTPELPANALLGISMIPMGLAWLRRRGKR